MLWSDARKAIKESSLTSSIYIGCDSQVRSVRRIINGEPKNVFVADYATVIILHKDSRHGCKIFYHMETLPDYGVEGMIARLWNEVEMSVKAYEAIKDVVNGRYLEIHVDTNTDECHASNRITNSALGYVRGLGIIAVPKPDGFAATHAADHCARRKSIFGAC